MLHLSPSRTKVVLLLWVLKCLYFCILKQKAKSYYTFKLRELISVFLKLIESRQTKIGWDYSCVWTVVQQMFVYLLYLLHGGAAWVQNLPTSGHKSMLHCRKIAVTENCCSWRGLNKPNSSLAVLHKLRFCVLKRVFFNMQVFITVSLIYCDFILKKKYCFLTLYLTSKLLLVVVSSAMFIFHQIMFVSNVCKS